MFRLFGPSNTILYFGCTIEFGYKNLKEVQKTLFDKLGLDFLLLREPICCGIPLKNAGFLEEYQKYKQRLVKVFEDLGTKRVICFCPSCTMGLMEALGPGVEVKFYIDFLYENYLDRFKKFKDGTVFSFHIPCHISRGLDNFETISKFLEHLNIKVKYPEESYKFSICCGGGGSFSSTRPELSLDLAKDKVSSLKKISEKVLTCCPMCYHQLTKAGANVQELSELLINLL